MCRQHHHEIDLGDECLEAAEEDAVGLLDSLSEICCKFFIISSEMRLTYLTWVSLTATSSSFGLLTGL